LDEAPKESQRKEKKQYAYTTIAHVKHDETSYVLANQGVVGVLRLLLALLLHKGLWQEGLTFLMDGQKTLQAAILGAFSWWGTVQLILEPHRSQSSKRSNDLTSLLIPTKSPRTGEKRAEFDGSRQKGKSRNSCSPKLLQNGPK